MSTSTGPAPSSSPRLSVLDLVPVRTGQTSAQAVHASLDLVRLADRLGFERFWFAEHHNMPAVAASTPPVMIAAAAAVTSRIRVGSGGVMLPNHAPLVVAEQFAALEAIAPGRVDLGIGRAPGSDPVVTQLLRITGPTADVDRFPQHVTDILALMSPQGAQLRLTSGQVYDVHATPAADGAPTVWLLGSSDYSAKLVERGPPFLRSVVRAFNAMTARLEKQEQLRRDLMADVAHELRTPLSVMRGRLEGILDGVYQRDDATLAALLDDT